MTPEEALKIDPARYSVHGDVATALRVLQNALREAQAQTVQMREDAARVADIARGGVLSAGGFATADRIAKAIRALPAPVARTYDDARREGVQAAFDAVHRVSALPYMDSPRSAFDAARIMREACQDAIAALLSPAPAVAPVAQKHDLPECDDCDGKGGFDGYGKPSDHPSALRACESCDGTGRVAPVAAPKPVAFDAEKALVAQADQLRHAIGSGRQYVTVDDVLLAIEAGLDAGRKP